jgi:hypothetical protein
VFVVQDIEESMVFAEDFGESRNLFYRLSNKCSLCEAIFIHVPLIKINPQNFSKFLENPFFVVNSPIMIDSSDLWTNVTLDTFPHKPKQKTSSDNLVYDFSSSVVQKPV